VTTLNLNRDKLRKAAATAPLVKFERRAAQAQRLYGSPFGHAIASFQSRLEARYRHDAEALRNIRSSIPQLEAFAAKRGMTGSDVQAMLGRVREYVEFPRDAATQEKIANNSFESMRLDRGSSEEATKAVGRFNTFMKDLRAEVPYVGRIASETGARVDRQFIELGARCAEHK
jgi:hypothetical protein